MTRPLNLVFIGLTLSSAWGNGHAVTYRALLRALAARGHRLTFLERDVPWCRDHRDLESPDYARLAFYDDVGDLERFAGEVASADAVIVGSYTPDGVAVGRWARKTARGVVAFYDIDTPVTLAALAGNGVDYLASDQIPDYDVYFSFTGGPTLAQLERRLGAPRARALFCSADADLYRPTAAPRRWDLTYLGTYSPDRQPGLERLLLEPARRRPDLRFAVAGPQYPADIVWPANVERLEHVPPADHPAFYGAGRMTLNLTRADMRAAGYSPSIRLFEAAACAAPIISDTWPGLESLFTPDREILLAEGTGAVLDALDRPDAELRAIGEAARERVLAEHTPAHRALALEQGLQEAMDERRTPVIARSRLNILVAGGAGFLGSHLCDRLLAEGHRVVCLDNLQTGDMANLGQALRRPGFAFVRHDITEPLPDRVATARFDRIYNLACAASPPQYQRDPEHTLMTNVIGCQRLLQLAERTGARYLLTSTSEVYGDPEVHPQPESYRGAVNPTGPRACYDEGKRCAETLSFDYDRAGRAEVRVARIFNTYGPRLSPADGRVVSNLVRQALAGEPVTVFGDGSQTRSFCYVADLIDGLVRLMEHEGPQPGPVNLGNPAELTVNELVVRVLNLTGSASKVTFQPLPVDDPRRRRPDITRAGEILDWVPGTDLETGLRATIAWFAADTAAAARGA